MRINLCHSWDVAGCRRRSGLLKALPFSDGISLPTMPAQGSGAAGLQRRAPQLSLLPTGPQPLHLPELAFWRRSIIYRKLGQACGGGG